MTKVYLYGPPKPVCPMCGVARSHKKFGIVRGTMQRDTVCVSCRRPVTEKRARQARAAALKAATPKWADRDAIAAIYALSARMTQETGVQHSVDHVVPLRSALVCGLHVPENLRVIPFRENSVKGASFPKNGLDGDFARLYQFDSVELVSLTHF